MPAGKPAPLSDEHIHFRTYGGKTAIASATFEACLDTAPEEAVMSFTFTPFAGQPWFNSTIDYRELRYSCLKVTVKERALSLSR